ncbi:MAG: type VI secretion system protein TssA [Proteobacteria bacterium]|nr:type VI secretion system protein TssA [Pseudomonadota bacterium]
MNLAELLYPLDDPDGPCGEDLSFSAEFDALQEARRFDDPTLAQGEWVVELKEADWAAVIRLSSELLAHRTKDLRVAAWFAEARCKRDGLAGLADGYELLLGLCEHFWDALHPLQEEDGNQESRAGVFSWWLAQTTRLLRELPLSYSPKGVFSLLGRERARSRAADAQQSGRESDGGRSGDVLATLDAAMRDTPRQHLVDNLGEIERLTACMQGLRTFLDARMGESGPSFGVSLDVLDDLSRSIRPYLGAGGESGAVEEPAGAKPGSLHVPVQQWSPGGGAGVEFHVQTIHSRLQAIHQLELIATYFRQTEPHSPVAYLADKAVRWGRMPLHEWLRSVVKDEAVLYRMEELLGLEGVAAPAAD